MRDSLSEVRDMNIQDSDTRFINARWRGKCGPRRHQTRPHLIAAGHLLTGALKRKNSIKSSIS